MSNVANTRMITLVNASIRRVSRKELLDGWRKEGRQCCGTVQLVLITESKELISSLFT